MNCPRCKREMPSKMGKPREANATNVKAVVFSLHVRRPAGDHLGREPWRFSYTAVGSLSVI